MGESVTVEIDKATYQEFEKLTKRLGLNIKEALAEAIEDYIEQRAAYVKDPFFQIGKAGRSGLGDLAKAHDKYLYSGSGIGR